MGRRQAFASGWALAMLICDFPGKCGSSPVSGTGDTGRSAGHRTRPLTGTMLAFAYLTAIPLAWAVETGWWLSLPIGLAGLAS